MFSATFAIAQTADGQRRFDLPEAAVKALIEAARTNDEQALIEIFGAKHRDLIGTVDKARDRENRTRFAESADEYRLLRPEDDGRVTLVVGYQAWPFPIPLVKEGSAWRFDTDAGWEELLNRRIGANELAVIETLRAYVEAQRQYASTPRDGTKVRQFAQKIRSSPGKHDGLYWEADPAKGEEPSPIGPLIRDASGRQPGDPYNGYYFKIVTRQGSAAPAGRYDYVINGRMIAGFAMVAFPADYGRTGVKTFIVNHYGVVYERDLGPNTAKIAAAMTEYNPDPSWKEVGD
ncbi:MAG: DUF2950 domain-containing protein [bacterium]|uniref:DUF2950 domain-containing protein n=2 Tax=Candidatus Methylomirabilis TaxID=1170227 RepID=A0AAJ1AJ05_9BACT|nr:DUF2950 domain-containing protein [Candidatus Methylomirabilis sp.]